MKSIFRTILGQIKSRRRLLVAAAVAAFCGIFVGGAAYQIFPGLRARISSPDWPGSGSPLLNGGGSGHGQNRLRDRQSRRLALNNPTESTERARQLAQAVMATIRNFYVDAERVSETKLGEIVIKVLRKKSSAIAATLNSNSIILGSQKKSRAFPLTTVGLVDAITEGSVLLSAEDTNGTEENIDDPDRGPLKKCREILNLVVAELDPHSSVLSPAAYNELRQGTEGSFGGLGVIVGLRERVLSVIKPLPNSPAAQAGILAGDRIVRINNQPTFGMALEDLMEFMRGSPGTHVTMRILREGGHSPMDVVIKREVIQVDSVTSHPVESGDLKILRLSVETFSAKTSREILSAIKSFKKNRGAIDGMILDLRSNPGGLLDQAVQVTDLFLEEGVIVSTRGRREEIEVAGKGYDEVDFPMVVLIDEESASASEIVAGALQDHGRAVILGQPSFGKGSVQTVFELPFDIALKLTIARYFTPLNRSIQNVGILPDLWLQPLFEKNENLNLFGQSRYRNEGFLLHRLDEKSGGRQYIVDLDQQMSESCCSKSYFLKRNGASENSDDDVDAAKKVLSAAHEAQIANRSQQVWGVGRTREWIRDQAVRGSVGKMAADAALWIRSRFGVEWDQPNERGRFHSLAIAGDTAVDFKVQSISGQTAIAGDESRFLWNITNKGDRAVRRLSVYLRSSGITGETQEILVGSVEPGESKSGVISCRAPFVEAEESWAIDVGLAMDAWPLMSLVRQFHVNVETRDRPALSFVTSIVGEKGGAANGILDPGEHANLRVVITNEGRVGVSDMSLNVVNLSGDRVAIAEGQIVKKPISAGSSTSIDIPLVFHGNQATEEVDLGISIESREMESPVVRQITLPVSLIAGRIGSADVNFPK